jgi:hypothetical protein
MKSNLKKKTILTLKSNTQQASKPSSALDYLGFLDFYWVLRAVGRRLAPDIAAHISQIWFESFENGTSTHGKQQRMEFCT